MFILVLAIAGGVFLTVILTVVIWVAASRNNDGPQNRHRGDEVTRGDYIGGSGRAPGDYVGGGPFF